MTMGQVQDVTSTAGGQSDSTVGLGVITALDGSEPHSDWGGWQGFIDQCCELRDEVDGVRYFGCTNCNYIVFPTGELLQNFGYHGLALMNRVRDDGWKETLRHLKAKHREFQMLMRETMTPNA
jgi:hypothetical protein